MSKKTYKLHSPLIKVRSKINTEDIYYTSKDFPEKIIEGKNLWVSKEFHLIKILDIC
jgi:hypothetical protein